MPLREMTEGTRMAAFPPESAEMLLIFQIMDASTQSWRDVRGMPPFIRARFYEYLQSTRKPR